MRANWKRAAQTARRRTDGYELLQLPDGRGVKIDAVLAAHGEALERAVVEVLDDAHVEHGRVPVLLVVAHAGAGRQNAARGINLPMAAARLPSESDALLAVNHGEPLERVVSMPRIGRRVGQALNQCCGAGRSATF